MSNTTTTWTHPLDYVRRRRWTLADEPAVPTAMPTRPLRIA